jgi:hypothetical protein
MRKKAADICSVVTPLVTQRKTDAQTTTMAMVAWVTSQSRLMRCWFCRGIPIYSGGG